MADPHWTSYVGMASGLLGAALGFMGYRKSNEIKKLDLRLEYRKAINNCNAAISEAEQLLLYANKSRERVAAATGKFRSGAMEQWKQDYDQDIKSMSELAKKAPSSETSYNSLSPKQLESKLVEIHALQNDIDSIKKKYQTAIDEDNKTREYLRNKNG